MGGHPGNVWLARSLDNTKLEKQCYQTTSMWGQMSKHLLPGSPSKSQKERAACTGGPCLVWLNWLSLLSARALPWHNGCQAAQCGLVVVLGSEWTGYENSGHAVIKANRWCSCINPAPLPCHPLRFMIKKWEGGSYVFNVIWNILTSCDWFSPIIIFHVLFLHSSRIRACVNGVFSHII